MLVLIIEDNPVSRLLAQNAVEHFGHKPVLANTAAAAWTMVITHDPEVILCDRLMPEFDGLTFCQRVRRRGVPAYFVFLTGLSERQEIREGIQAGADAYLTKPLDRLLLESALLTAQRWVVPYREVLRRLPHMALPAASTPQAPRVP